MQNELFRGIALAILLLGISLTSIDSFAATNNDDLLATVRQYYEEKNYQQVIDATDHQTNLSPDLFYLRGMAQARLERWNDAKQSFESAERIAPKDPRFPLELAGVLFKQKDLKGAKEQLRHALSLQPKDEYGLNFLGTLYVLDGNLEAALKYWNRIGKPTVHSVKTIPQVRLKSDILNRAFETAADTQLKLEDLEATKANLDSLEVFPRYKFDLVSKEDGQFDFILHPMERNGWGYSWIEGLLGISRGVLYETIYPEFFNIGHRAINSLSLIRWDDDKQRISSVLSGPLKGSPQWRYRVGADFRDEDWDVTNSFQGPLPLSDLLIEKYELMSSIENNGSGRWGWLAGVSYSDRDFTGSIPAIPEEPELFVSGSVLKGFAGLQHPLLNMPEHRLKLESSVRAEFGKAFSEPSAVFSQLTADMEFNWFPAAKGDDYAMNARLRAGTTLGEIPFDELFQLGMERDNDLWLRAHNGMRKKKGFNAMGRDYVLVNWEIEKVVFRRPFFQISLGPFVDTGNVYDVNNGFGAEKWLFDVGLQFKMRLLDSITFAPVYGIDLRTGNGVFYVVVSRR